MPAKKKTRLRQTPHGRRIDVARIVSVGQDRDTGEAITSANPERTLRVYAH